MLPQIDQSNNLEPQVPLETGTFISDLVTSNPAPSDPLSNADDHARLIKATIKATFPNITGAITSSNANIDAAVTATNTNGVAIIADAGAFFKTHTTDGFTNPASGEIDLKLAGTIAARFLNNSGVLSLVLPGSLSVTGALTSTGPITAPGIVPVGGMIMWLSDTLPATSSGSWCWANGGVLSRTGNGAALWTLWGNTSPYGLGDGVTTFNVINMCEASPVGKSGMGGAGSPGLLNSISSGLKSALGAVFGSDTSTLSTSNLPPYTPSGTVVTTLNPQNDGGPYLAYTVFGSLGLGGSANGGLLQAATASSTFTGAPQGGTSTPFNNVGPLRVCNFIIRIG